MNIEQKLKDMSLQIQHMSRTKLEHPLKLTEQQELESEEVFDENVEINFSDEDFRLDRNAVYGIHDGEDNRIFDFDTPDNENESPFLEDPYLNPKPSTSTDEDP